MLGELLTFAEVLVGHPFRGSVPEVADGPALAIQMRDISIAAGVDWSTVMRTRLQGRKQPDWLQPGDILFVAKGARNFAVCLGQVPAPAVCSQYFFLIRVHDSKQLLPEFLAWQINQLPAQRYFGKNAEGTDQLSIRRGVLEALPIAVPAMAQQHALIRLDQAVRQERQHLESLIHNRQQQIQALSLQLLAEQHSSDQAHE
ncbi:restriction endonuclease subunit S domain-containing protein [Collimonas silvisoli]|uniref:restriction endonuclease subunit S n=1 Tax=Collimonas silvisoli TaxID=2825884 RepID=UPI001B8B4D49|nr:restriction endonuclease subunit S [Collimonas silvisoli]